MPPYLAEMEINQEGLLLLSSKPAITFDLRYAGRCFRETENLRYKETTGDETQKSEPEKSVDVEDEGPDCVRYAMQSDLFWRRPIKKLPHNCYKAQLQRRYLRRKRRKR